MKSASAKSAVAFFCSSILGLVVAKLIHARVLSTSKQAGLFIVTPVFVFVISSITYMVDLNTMTLSDAATAGAVFGMIITILTISPKPPSLKLIIKNSEDSTTHELEFEDFEKVTVNEIHASASSSFGVSLQALRFETGRGCLAEDLDKAAVTDIINIIPGKDSGSVQAIAYIAIDHESSAIGALEGKKVSRRTSLMRLIPQVPISLNMKAEVKPGVPILLHGKIPNAANDANSFKLSSVASYAAGTTKTSSSPDTPVYLLRWKDKSGHLAIDDDGLSVGARSVVSVSSEAVDNEPIKSGDSVILRHDGK